MHAGFVVYDYEMELHLCCCTKKTARDHLRITHSRVLVLQVYTKQECSSTTVYVYLQFSRQGSCA